MLGLATARTTLVRVKLHTGRKHQIRAQLSERGVPIVGDRMYGESSRHEPRLLLVHALRDELLIALDKFKAKAAAGLVTDVRTGEIVSMV